MTNQAITGAHLSQFKAPSKTGAKKAATPKAKKPVAKQQEKKDDKPDEGGSAHAFDDL